MKAVRQSLGPRALFGEPMSRHTTWRVGGPCLCLARVESASEIREIRRLALEEGLPVMALGNGSNLLVADEGFQGFMIKAVGPLAGFSLAKGRVVAGAGALLPGVCKAAAKAGLSGLAWAAGIPATVGGAVAGNAGAFGGSMADVASSLSLLLANGLEEQVPGRDLPAGYRRRSLPPDSMVLWAEMDLMQGDAGREMELMEGYRAKRRAGQPLGAATAGSVFKNPPGDAAGRLIEAAGLKGAERGGARVSPVHANFIENTGKATAKDILGLIEAVEKTVAEKFGVRLSPEVRVVGHA